MNNEIIKWLGRIPDKDTANLAIQRHIEFHRNTSTITPYDGLSYGQMIQWAIAGGFDWDETEEGQRYWEGQHEAAERTREPRRSLSFAGSFLNSGVVNFTWQNNTTTEWTTIDTTQ